MSAATEPQQVVHWSSSVGPGVNQSGRRGTTVLRAATMADADVIHALIVAHLADGHLLPRRREEIAVHAGRFVVATRGDQVLASAELAPLSRTVAEVRSLVVGTDARRSGVGHRIVNELMARATRIGFEEICAFTHAPSYFVRMGFSIVPHAWLPEKIATTCSSCPQFRHCGQHAVVLSLGRAR